MSLLAAFLLGFIAHRAGLCTVKAVAEIFTTRRFYILASFAKTVIWIVVFSFAGLVFFNYTTPYTHWPLTFYSIGGGLLFGVAAAANGGCTFSTLTRLGDGDTNFAATVLGWPIGAWLEKMVSFDDASMQPRTSMLAVIDEPFLYIAAAFTAIWLIWQAIVIIGLHPQKA